VILVVNGEMVIVVSSENKNDRLTFAIRSERERG